MTSRLPFTSLNNAASSPQVGASKDLEGTFGTHYMLTSTTGSPSSYNVDLEGSHDDGTTWISLVSATVPGATAALAINTPLRFVRAHLTSLSGGTSPTVTASIASL